MKLVYTLVLRALQKISDVFHDISGFFAHLWLKLAIHVSQKYPFTLLPKE